MNLAFSTNAFVRRPLAEAIETIAALGYQGIEIMADRPHAWPADLAAADLAGIRVLLRQHNLQLANLNAFTMQPAGDTWHPSWIDPDPRRRQERIDHTCRCLRMAEALGAPHLSTEPGGPLPPGMGREEALSFFRAGLAEVAEEAAKRKVRVLLEPEPGLLIETGEEFASFFAGLDPDLFGLNFDAGHFFCVGEDPANAFRRLRPAIHHVHLEDIGADRMHRHLLPGEGALPLPEFLQTLAETDYSGFITVELYPYQERPAEAAAVAFDCLRRLNGQERTVSHDS